MFLYMFFIHIKGQRSAGVLYGLCSGDRHLLEDIEGGACLQLPVAMRHFPPEEETARSNRQGILPFCCFLAVREKISCDVVQSLWLKKVLFRNTFFYRIFLSAAACGKLPQTAVRTTRALPRRLFCCHGAVAQGRATGKCAV